MDAALSSVPGQVGTLVVDADDGRVLASSGELSQAADTARVLRAMLQDVAKIVNTVPFQRLEIAGKTRSYIVTLADKQILAVVVKTGEA